MYPPVTQFETRRREERDFLRAELAAHRDRAASTAGACGRPWPVACVPVPLERFRSAAARSAPSLRTGRGDRDGACVARRLDRIRPGPAPVRLATVLAMPGRRFGAFTSEDPPERPADPAIRKANFRRIVRLFGPYRARLAAVCTLIVFSAGSASCTPFLLREVLDVAIPEENVGLLTSLVAGMVAIPILTGVLGVWQTLLSNQVGQSVMHDLRIQVYRHLQRLSLAFFTRTRTGEVQSRIANDIGGIETVVTSTATSVLANVTTVLATVVAMVLLDWRLAVFSLALLPLFVWLTKRVGAQRKKVTAERQASLADVSSIVQESLSVSGILLGKTMGRTEDLAQRFEAESERLAALEVRSRMTGPLDDGRDPDVVRGHARARVLVRRVHDRAGLRDHHHRNARRVHDAPDAAVLPDRQPPRRPARGAELARALRPDLRVPRPRGRRRGGCEDAREPARRGPARRRLVPVRRRGLDARGRVLLGPGGDEDRARGRDRLRKDDVRVPRRAALRRDPGNGLDRRRGRARAHLRVARRDRRSRVPGDLPLPRDRAREPPLREA